MPPKRSKTPPKPPRMFTVADDRYNPPKGCVSNDPNAAADEFMAKSDFDHAKTVFEKIDAMEPKSKKTWRKKQELCRYPDIPCEEETRFVLEGGKEDNDFIHASKVTFEGVSKEYIIAMAPIKKTMEDFWRMVYQSRAPSIVLLGPFSENGKELQEQFWPEMAGEKKVFGRMVVTQQSVRQSYDRTIYKLVVKTTEGDSEHTTALIHLLFYAPSCLDYNQNVRLSHDELHPSASPLIAVGGSGTSRACTFVLIDALLARLMKEIPTSLEEMATELRRQRAMSFHNNKKCFYFAVYQTHMHITCEYSRHTTLRQKMAMRYIVAEKKKE